MKLLIALLTQWTGPINGCSAKRRKTLHLVTGFPSFCSVFSPAITVRHPRRLVTRTTRPTPNDDIDFGARQVAGMQAACLTLVCLSCFKYRIDVTFWASVKLNSHGNMFVPPPRMNPDVTCYYTRE